MSGRTRTLAKSLGRVALGILLFWAFTPILVVLGFLGWATVAAEGVWQIVFGVCTLVMVAALARWIRGILVRRERSKAARMAVAAPPRTSPFGDPLAGFEPQF